MHSRNSRHPRSLLRALTITVATAVVLTGCGAASDTASPASTAPSADGGSGSDGSISGHGAVAGATEMPEPQLGLATVASDGDVALLDLVTGESAGVGALGDVASVSTNGRYLFATLASGEGVTIVDSGAWTVPHGDHFHYYLATPRVVGTVEGTVSSGIPAVVASGTSRTALFFGETGTGIVLDGDALGSGSIEEIARIESAPHNGALVPVGELLLGTVADEAGISLAVQVYNGDGTAVAGEASRADCAEFSGTITTNVGVVFGCADGVLLATEAEAGEGSAAITFERIPYPDGTAPADRATAFDSRIGRPSVAAAAGTAGAWLLNTRERTLTLVPTDTPLLLASAVSDTAGMIVAVALDGRVLVIDPATGLTVSATEPLLAASLADSELRAGVTLQVDASRAYVNAAAENLVYEIDFADGARIARSLPAPTTPVHFAEIGR